MEKRINTKNRAWFVVGVIFASFLIVLVPMVVFSACIYTPTALFRHYYDFRIEGNYLVWADMNATYSVTVFNDGYDPLKARLDEQALERPWQDEDEPMYVILSHHIFGARGRVSLADLRLTAGPSAVRVISGNSNYNYFDSTGGCCAGIVGLSGVFRQAVGFWGVYVIHDYTMYDYEFSVQNLGFRFNGGAYDYAVSVLNNEDEYARFIRMAAARHGIRFELLGLLAGSNVIKVHRIKNATYYMGVLNLGFSKGIWNIELEYDDYFPDFGFEVLQSGANMTATLNFDRFMFAGAGTSLLFDFRAYIENKNTCGFEFLFEVVPSEGNSILLSHIRQAKGHNALRLVSWRAIEYNNGLIVARRRVGEWSFDYAVANDELHNIVNIRRITRSVMVDGEWVRTYEWGVFISVMEGRVISQVGIDRHDGNGFFMTWLNNGGIEANRLVRGHNTLLIKGFDYDWCDEYSVLTRINRQSYIRVFLHDDGTISILD